MIEQLKQVRFVLSILSGNAKVDELRKKIITEAGATDKRTGKPLKYADLPEQEKKDCDEAVEGLQELQGVFDDIVKAKAKMTMKFYKALQEAGFKADEALQIVSRQGVGTGVE